MAVQEREKMYECEVKRRRVKDGGGYEPFWKVKKVADALVDGDTEFRCKDCRGEGEGAGQGVEAGARRHTLSTRRRPTATSARADSGSAARPMAE